MDWRKIETERGKRRRRPFVRFASLRVMLCLGSKTIKGGEVQARAYAALR